MSNQTCLTSEQIQENKDRYIKAVTSTGREGIDNFLTWLDTTDFYISPASTKYHGSYKGGLLVHHLNVINLGVAKLRAYKVFCPACAEQELINSYILSAACHDLCKVDIYKPVYYKIGENKGELKEYKVEDTSGLNLGHGEKSAVMALMAGLKLIPEELSAIRWHMGLWDAGARENYPSGYSFTACHNTWLGRILSTSDYEAALLEGE